MNKYKFSQIIATNVAWCIENNVPLWDCDWKQIEKLSFPLSFEDGKELSNTHPVFMVLDEKSNYGKDT